MIEQLKKLGFFRDSETLVWISERETSFSYNDGDEIENYILDSVRSCEDRSVSSSELKKFIKDWASLYHFSNRRVNILRPFASYLKGKKILEIGCGCGALSRYLGEIEADLISVEGSARRALIARERCKGLKNVEVVMATSDKISELRDFDVVILNGVLEYSPKYLGDNGPSILLKSSFNQLNERGVLILAIENQLGLKYFSGQPEDHAGHPMYGINNSYRKGEFKTWGKKELISLVQKNGFQEVSQYIPLPDYKLPVSIITPLGWEKYSEELSQLALESSYQDPQRIPHELFSLEMAYKTTWKNGLASDLANSFLMVASKSANLPALISKDIAAFHYTDGRQKGLNKGLEVISKESKLKVRSFPLDGFLKDMKDSTVKLNILEMDDFYTGESLWFELLSILNRPGWKVEEISFWANSWLQALKENAGLPQNINDIDHEILGKFWDATPFNAVRNATGKIQFFDLEWEVKEKLPLGQIIFHGLFQSLLRITSIAPPAESEKVNLLKIIEEIFLGLGFRISWEKLLEIEKMDRNLIALMSGTTPSEKEEEDILAAILWKRTLPGELIYEIKKLNSAIESIYNSTSWKVSKPVRIISNRLKRK